MSLSNIPKIPKVTRWLHDHHRDPPKSPHAYMQTPPLPIVAVYWCLVRIGGMCSAPPGIRCRCGSQLDGHDPGDEDPIRP